MKSRLPSWVLEESVIILLVAIILGGLGATVLKEIIESHNLETCVKAGLQYVDGDCVERGRGKF